MRSKINPEKVHEMLWKDYVKAFQKDIKKAQSEGLESVPIVVISNFKFACGEEHALMLLGKESVMKKFYKGLKIDRKQEKDFAIGNCIFEKEENGDATMKIEMTGVGKPAHVKKNSKKLMKRLGVTLKDVIKGEFVDDVAQSIEQEELNATAEEQGQNQTLQTEAQEMQAQDDKANDTQEIAQLAKDFQQASQAVNKEVVLLLKQTATDPSIVFTSSHISLAENAFRTAASLVDKYEELDEAQKQIKGFDKITAFVEKIQKDNLVKKYEAIWRKTLKTNQAQIATFSEALQAKFGELDSLLKDLEKDLAS